MISTPMKEGTMDKQHLTLIGDKDSPKHLIFPDMNAKFLHEQTKENTMDLSPEHRQHSTSPDIEMGIGIDCKKVDDGKVNGKKKKRTRCNCPNCVKRVSKRREKAIQILTKTSFPLVIWKIHTSTFVISALRPTAKLHIFVSICVSMKRTNHLHAVCIPFCLIIKFGIRNSVDWHLCTWRFYRSEDLQRHRLKHTGEKRFECAQCGRISASIFKE
jgi:hypothetical protein